MRTCRVLLVLPLAALIVAGCGSGRTSGTAAACGLPGYAPVTLLRCFGLVPGPAGFAQRLRRIELVVGAVPAVAVSVASADVPRLSGLTISSAVRALADRGLCLGAVDLGPVDTAREPRVRSQRPRAGDPTPLRTRVSVTLTAGGFYPLKAGPGCSPPRFR